MKDARPDPVIHRIHMMSQMRRSLKPMVSVPASALIALRRSPAASSSRLYSSYCSWPRHVFMWTLRFFDPSRGDLNTLKHVMQTESGSPPFFFHWMCGTITFMSPNLKHLGTVPRVRPPRQKYSSLGVSTRTPAAKPLTPLSLQ